MTTLPPSVHPRDVSEPFDPNNTEWGHSYPVEDDTSNLDNNTGARRRGRQAYSIENSEALPVYQRASSDWNVGIVYVSLNNGGTVIAASEQKGRQSVTLSVPTALPDGGTAVGVLFGPTEDSVQNTLNSGVLNPGDAVTIPTEAKVYVGLLPGQTAGTVQVMVVMNPAQGPLG